MGDGEDFADQADAQPPAAPPKRTPAKKTAAAKAGADKPNPGGSTNRLREETLVALGVLKIATADQLWRLLRPNAKENKVCRAALNDLGKLVASDGSTKEALKTWRLTEQGRTAAEQVLPTGRPVGSIAKGAGSHGAAHAMAVNDTIISFVRGALDPKGDGAMGTITAWSTEVPLEPRTGLKVRPDAVLRAPEHDLPVLLVEVDRHTEGRPVLAAKFPAYAAVFAHQTKVPDPASPSGKTTTVPYWQQLFPDPVREGYPPVAVVFADNGTAEVTRNRMQALLHATREQWAGDSRTGHYTDYTHAIPIVVTTLELLRAHGPQAPIWWRFGHTGRETLHQALANPDDAAGYWRERRARERRAALEAERQEREAEREELRDATRCPVCHRAADQYEDPDDASVRGTPSGALLPCQPCIRTADQARHNAVAAAFANAVPALSSDLQDRTAVPSLGLLLTRAALDWREKRRDRREQQRELDRLTAEEEASVQGLLGPAEPAEPEIPTPATARPSNPQTAVEQLLAEARRRAAAQAAADRADGQPRRVATAVRGSRTPQQDHSAAAAHDARFSALSEPLRSKLIARAEQEDGWD
ncbi:replication-relaxation family protein [Streptacidiphilus sp. N1-12]|uniref:Replication-relaxation family protein n=1 Tax=Streptacidiphilus alkalitolerans TaxID=3342712 RepID=A0ABV6WRD1_9ACTN